MLHYLYFPNREIAVPVVAKLRERGFQTEERLGADEENWLILAKHKIVPSEEAMTETRELMEGLTRELGGEYDGWEVAVAE